ncbi:hypothetical protein SAMN05192558_11736 [Actinokineospora alba]|uniref:Glutathionylspermidine synthase n=1 Tax=Actinokineospora alba TaxID=504798 RepID=A0A1H0W2Q8_9PSEU|nr:hypothetical protein [Actinokineospora alba]TDP67792.1 hypothetical protein C8E96_3344 [Actinokineospora alba]SDI71949.1 hypothetical protein SAMN05421871_10736 [Actinokineospora alba]SDP84815.1 hypothetical protein SAMN05192558_11736 [Actinokineospora alba]
MDRVSLTRDYLARVVESGAKAGELTGDPQDSALLETFYSDRYLSRPLFLGHAEQVRLHTDLENLRQALASLPDRLFGGDFAAFARAVGLSEVQVAAVMRGRGPAVSRQTRADLYADGDGFKLLELNIGSAVGGMDNADLCRELLAHPALADFAGEHGLGFVDSLREQVNNIRVESGFGPGDSPVVALTDTPEGHAKMLPYMDALCARWREHGLDAHPAHLGQLQARDGRVWLDGRPVDVVFRAFLIGDLLKSPEIAALLDPLLDAAERGEVTIFTPLDSAAYASKGALAMLSDERNRGLFGPEELASLDRLLPWTRRVSRGPVTLEGGERVDLVDYTLANQQELALKPTSLAGGEGVLLGWARDLTPHQWREQILAAVDGPYVLQRRVRPTPEQFPDEHGDLRPWTCLWGVFTVVNGYGGAYIRATPTDSGSDVVNIATGAYAGPVLHQTRAAHEE